jgi:FMN reductase
MRIVAIGGSTRSGSSTEVLLRAVLDAAEELGATTMLFSGPALLLPPYEPRRRLPRKAAAIIEAVRDADALVFGSPGYHGTLSGLVKNALDYLEELSGDERPYVDGLPVACVVTADGWQAAVNTLRALRETVHALRGWPTPLGLAVNVAEGLLDDTGEFRDTRLVAQINGVASQLVSFAHTDGGGTSSDVERCAEQLRRAITLGRFGDGLPPARDVAAQLGVDEATARRALADVASSRPTPTFRREDAIAAFASIIEFRIANECAAARLAATRATPEDAAALRSAITRMSRAMRAPPSTAAVARFHAADDEFHRAVAGAARSPLIERAVSEARQEMFQPVGAVFPRLRRRAGDLHEAIADAIIAGDADAAAAAMAAHIEATRQDIEATLGTGAVLA